MKQNIKNIAKKTLEKVKESSLFTRVLAQAVMFITTFKLHESSPFWHVVCLLCLIVVSLQTVSGAAASKTLKQKSAEVVDILQTALSDLVENGDIDSILQANPPTSPEEKTAEELPNTENSEDLENEKADADEEDAQYEK